VIQSAVGGRPLTQMIEGGKSFDITLRWPKRLRDNEQAILDIPVDLGDHVVLPSSGAAQPATPLTGGSTGLSPTGTTVTLPALTGSSGNAPNLPSALPRRRVGDFVTALDENGLPNEKASFLKPGASTIYREEGQRLIAVKFDVKKGRGLSGVVA